MKPSGIKRAVLIPLIVALIGLAVGFAAVLTLTRERLYERDLAHATTTFRSLLDSRIETAGRLMETAYAAVLSDTKINSAFGRRDPGALLRAAEPLYKRLSTEHRISHFYFMDGDGRIILRVHAPSRFGDVADRATFRRARETDAPSRGIELGPLGTLTLRLVAPVHDRGYRLGFVEFGIEMEDLVGDMRDDRKGSTYLFVYKDLLERTDWEAGVRLSERKVKWDEFPGVVQAGMAGDAGLPSALHPVVTGLRPGEKRGTTSFQVENEDRLFLAALLPVEDVSGWEVGKVVVTVDVSPVRQAFHRDLVSIVAATFLVGLVLVSFVHWLLDRVQKRLAQAEAQLVETARVAQAASEAKTMFLAMVSHELRTPLNAIIGFSEMMKTEMLGPMENKAYKEYVGDIHRSGTDLLRLINDILDITRLEGGHIELHPQPVNPREVAESCIRSVSGRARREGISVSAELPSGLPPVLADELRLKQVLLNLLTNAIKFTSVGGSVQLSAEVEGEVLAFRVADTGIGMDPEDVPKVLDPFVQLADQMTRPHEGAGLGLPLTKNLVELHGGSLEIETAPGKGTTVTARFPLAPYKGEVDGGAGI